MSVVSVQGHDLYYEEHGHGPETVVFAHGLLWSGRMFEASGGVLGIAEGWHRGPTATPVKDPNLLGPIVAELVAKARKNAGMNGLDIGFLVGVAGVCASFGAWRFFAAPPVPVDDSSLGESLRYASP